MDCTPSEKNSFLSLPKPIRERIYLLAGLIVDYDINFDWRVAGYYNMDYTGDDFPWRHFKYNPKRSGNLRIFLVCRLVYAEASAIVYSSNRFIVRYQDTNSLKPLMELNATSLACLTHLTVYLNVVSCKPKQLGSTPDCCSNSSYKCWTCKKYYELRKQKPLGTSPKDKEVLSEWQSVARFMATRIKGSHFRLYLVCDVEHPETGQLAVQPLKYFPALADCSIRLHHTRHRRLRHVAVEAASEAMGFSSRENRTPFRFLDLPIELRLRILEFTDLVTPEREVTWTPQKKFHIYKVRMCCNPSCWPQMAHICCIRKCWMDVKGQNHIPGCFCHRDHASFSTQCNCWLPPTPLFLVCKALLQDARHVFFNKNLFIISPAAGCTYPVHNTPKFLEAWVFLKKCVPPSALQSLRSLEIVFPPFYDDYLRPGEPAYKQWLEVVDYMCQLNLPVLSLSVVMSDTLNEGYELDSEFPKEEFRTTMTRQQALVILRMYLRTLVPLFKLRKYGLEAFFMTLASPYAWNWKSKPEHAGEKFQRMKDRQLLWMKLVERWIMGEGYDCKMFLERSHGKSMWLYEKEHWDLQMSGPMIEPLRLDGLDMDFVGGVKAGIKKNIEKGFPASFMLQIPEI